MDRDIKIKILLSLQVLEMQFSTPHNHPTFSGTVSVDTHHRHEGPQINLEAGDPGEKECVIWDGSWEETGGCSHPPQTEQALCAQ